MTKDDDGMARGGGEQLGTAELRRVLTRQLGYALPADLVITTRAEIEAREFTAYGRGWHDCVEHRQQHRAEEARTARDPQAQVLAFPRQKQTSPPAPARRPAPPAGDEPS
ncbi:hypothetical protein [Streptomyces sp. NPDC050528]|uniref:hypothetical protein n=1 Tax=unclassified Streptomyces TaxID=2593676 RepID=UPI0037BC85D1